MTRLRDSPSSPVGSSSTKLDLNENAPSLSPSSSDSSVEDDDGFEISNVEEYVEEDNRVNDKSLNSVDTQESSRNLLGESSSIVFSGMLTRSKKRYEDARSLKTRVSKLRRGEIGVKVSGGVRAPFFFKSSPLGEKAKKKIYSPRQSPRLKEKHLKAITPIKVKRYVSIPNNQKKFKVRSPHRNPTSANPDLTEANTDAARKESKRRLGPSENLKISSSPKSPVIESKKLLPENIIDPNSNFTQGENFFNFSTDIETSGVKTRSQSSVILSDSSGSSHPLPFDKKATSSIQNPRTNIKSRAEGKPTVILRHDSPIVRHLKSFGKNVSSQRDNNPKSLTRSIFKDDTRSVNETERMIKQPMLKSPVRIDYGRTMNFKEFLDLENSRKQINKIENSTLSSKIQSESEEIEGEYSRPLKRVRLQKSSKEIDLLHNPIASPSRKTFSNKQNSGEGPKSSAIKEPSRNLRPRIKLTSPAFHDGSRFSKNSTSLKKNQTIEQTENKSPICIEYGRTMNFKEFMDLENSRKKINKIENYTLSSKSQSKYEEIEGEDFRPLKRARLQKLSKEIDLLQNPIASPSSKTSANKQNSEEGSKNSTIKEPSRNLRPRIKLASSAFDNGSRVSKNSASLKRNQTTEQKVNKRPSRQNTFESIDNLMHKNNSNDWTSSKKKITVKIPPNGLHTNSKKKRHVNNSEKGSNARPHSLRPYQITQGHKNLPQSNRDPEHEPGISSIAKGKQKAITVINDKSMGSFSQVGPSSLTGMKNFRNSQSKNLSIFDDLINARIEASKMKETLGDLMMKNLKMDATKSLYSSSENPQSNSSSSETEQGLLANPKETLHSEQSSSSSEKSSTNDDHGGDLKKNSQVVRPFPIINVSNFNQTHKKAPLSKLNFWSWKSYQSETSSSSIGIGESEDETNLDEKSRFNFFDFSNDTCNAIS